MPVKCKICGGDVPPPRKAYCSDECAREARLRRKRAAPPRRSPGGKLYIERICQDCGARYTGHIKSKRCPGCQAEADRRADADAKQRAAQGRVRRIGSTDLCELCGEPYIVAGGRQRYCKSCADKATLNNIRAHKREWNKEYYADAAHREQKNSARRRGWQQARACAICGKPFTPAAPSEKYCCAECRTQGNRDRQRRADAKRRPKTPSTKKEDT